MNFDIAINMTADHLETNDANEIEAVRAAVYRFVADNYPHATSVRFIDREWPGLTHIAEPWLRIAVGVTIEGTDADGVIYRDTTAEDSISDKIRNHIIDSADTLVA